MFNSWRTAYRLFTAFVVLGLGQLTPCLALDRPVLVELFTSEGCSSCPPADRYLAGLRKSNRNIILIGEHVDYWNGLGWADQFSSATWTERQQNYCRKLGARSCYTPQAVINGQRECVASDQSAVQKAMSETADALTVPVDIKILKQEPNSVDVSVSVGDSSGSKDIALLLVEDGVVVQVQRGENGGRLLRHDGVVRAQTKIKNVKGGTKVSATLPLNSTDHPESFRIVALLEDANGPSGAAQLALPIQQAATGK